MNLLNMKTTKAQKENQLIINLDDVRNLAIEGGKLMYTPDAEQAIVDLLVLQELVENSIASIKQQIAEAGQALDPNFKGIVGHQIKSVYRAYGEKYSYDGNFNTPKEVLKTITTVKVFGNGVEAYVKEHNKLPEGIVEKERTPVLSLVKIDYEPEYPTK